MKKNKYTNKKIELKNIILNWLNKDQLTKITGMVFSVTLLNWLAIAILNGLFIFIEKKSRIFFFILNLIFIIKSSKQSDLYEESFYPLVESVINGFNGTIFAYGQTGTGKTFTMEGVRTVKELRGVIPNSFDHIFSAISRSTDQQYLVRAQYLEIYQVNKLNNIFDILNILNF